MVKHFHETPKAVTFTGIARAAIIISPDTSALKSRATILYHRLDQDPAHHRWLRA